MELKYWFPQETVWISSGRIKVKLRFLAKRMNNQNLLIDPSDYCSNTVFEDATPELFLFLHNDREYIIDEYGKQEDHIGVAKSLQFDVIKC
ncbi:hypothetical protein C5167_044358 [Papaver somniferum]|uniref:Uncharacterized protein n=1 Tax=Papaver somniferum TaxID=3469 RepID=A0A4Y7LC59_PAPSO|nr:hypothetical protein C5167_044358 [Papaver somniferum]